MAILKANSKSEKGQVLVESVLMLVLLIGLLTLTSRTLKDKKVIQGLVQKPWGIISGMIENGTWKEASSGRTLHPNGISNFQTKQCGDSGGC